jgi:parvulin-like peptidyl-prolyl isomerase
VKQISPSLLIRAVAYLLAMIYLTIDLVVVEGPLHRRLNPGKTQTAPRDPATVPAARIFGWEIPMRMLDQAVAIRAMRSGRSTGFFRSDDPGLRSDLRLAALDSLLNDLAVDAKMVARPSLYDEAATDRMLAEEEIRLGGREALDAALAEAGLGRNGFRAQLRSHLARSRYLEEFLESAGANKVSDALVADWLEALPEVPMVPARLKLRHIFKAALHQDPVALEEKIKTLHTALLAGSETFAAVAARESDDAATAAKGGELGWVEGPDPRWPEGLDFNTLAKAPRGKVLPPMLSKLGWHLFIVDDLEAARPMNAERDGAEIRAHLINGQRAQVLRDLLDAIRKEGDTVIFQQALQQVPWTLECGSAVRSTTDGH